MNAVTITIEGPTGSGKFVLASIIQQAIQDSDKSNIVERVTRVTRPHHVAHGKKATHIIIVKEGGR